jgi:NAD(P)-dependent dehydrogenase (short-subunit alcohol dehydrogenase family)
MNSVQSYDAPVVRLDLSQRLVGKVAVVTGGASGIGLATAQRFAAEGAEVVIADIQADAGRRAASSIKDASSVWIDTADAKSVSDAFAEILGDHGRVDVLFNNAGVDGEQWPLHEMPDENWERVMRVNATGAFHVIREGAAAMLRGRGGSIINMSSSSALSGKPNLAPYTFAKAGLVGLTRSAAIEYADRGIRVNAIAPTVVLTPLVEHFIESSEDPKAMREYVQTMNPIPGMPLPKDVAAVVAFLASDDAAWVTGHTLPIDGGFNAR